MSKTSENVFQGEIMQAKDRIYIAPKPCRLPRQGYNERTVQQKLRWVALWLFLGAMFWAGVWWKYR